jgi:hypothetical protein
MDLIPQALRERMLENDRNLPNNEYRSSNSSLPMAPRHGS